MKIKYVVASLILSLSSFIFISCGTTRAATETAPKIQPRFDYAPKTSAEIGSAGITIALVNPTFGDPRLRINPFESMRENLSNDFEELLTAKGFKIRGPFNQFGEMLYNDKVNSDFVFEVEVDMNLRGIDRHRRTITKTNWGNVILNTGSQTSYYFKYWGDGTFVCSLVLTAYSSNFREKMWKKSIELPSVPFKYQGSVVWNSMDVTLLDEIKEDNVVFNEIAGILESQYNEILDLIEKQIDVEEMKMVAKEARTVDRKD